MKYFEKFLKNEGIENAVNMPADALQALLNERTTIMEMAMLVEQTGISPVVFGCTEKKTGIRKEYYITAEMLFDLMQIIMEINEMEMFNYEN